MERRRLLIGTGVTAVSALAGCLGSDDDEDSSESESASHTEEQADDADDTAADENDEAGDGDEADDETEAEGDETADAENDDADDTESDDEDDDGADDADSDDEGDADETGGDDEDDATVSGIDDERLAATLKEHDIQIKTYTYEDGKVDLTLLTETELANEIANADGSPDETWAQEAQDQLEAIAASLDESITDDSEVKSTVDSVHLTVLDEEARPIVRATITGNDLVNGVDESTDLDDVGIDGLIGV